MILHLRHIFLTEALTFIVVSNRVLHGSLLSTRQEIREDTLFFLTLQVFCRRSASNKKPSETESGGDRSPPSSSCPQGVKYGLERTYTFLFCRNLHPGGTKALEVSLLEQILILLRHHVSLNLAHKVHRHNHNDQ